MERRAVSCWLLAVGWLEERRERVSHSVTQSLSRDRERERERELPASQTGFGWKLIDMRADHLERFFSPLRCVCVCVCVCCTLCLSTVQYSTVPINLADCLCSARPLGMAILLHNDLVGPFFSCSARSSCAHGRGQGDPIKLFSTRLRDGLAHIGDPCHRHILRFQVSDS